MTANSGKESEDKMNGLKRTRTYLAFTVAALFWLGGVKPAAAQDDSTQTSQLFRLQAAYHRAATVRDYVNGDSPQTITDRIRAVLSLFTSDAILYLNVGGPRDGFYLGNGDPDDQSTCPPPSTDPNNRGTLCTFYKYISGSFLAANRFVALTPSFKESFDPRGDMATVYFECHYFNVAPDPVTGRPLWTAASHASFTGLARKVNGNWLFSYAIGGVPPVPLP
jgi:hypothetical protein